MTGRARWRSAGRRSNTWRGILDDDEPIWISLTALHEAGLVLREHAAGVDAEPLRARLDEFDLEHVNGCLATHKLLVQVRATLDH